MFTPYEIKSKQMHHNVVEDHEKIFFIIQQGTLDGSFRWNNNRVDIPHYKDKPMLPKEEANRVLINHMKLHLALRDGIFDIVNKYFSGSVMIGNYTLIKTMGEIDFELPDQRTIVYLPQTNQAYLFDQEFDRRIFTTHAYVVMIPISAPSRT
jgi:hypothetical protein